MGSLLGDLLMFFHQELKNAYSQKTRLLKKKHATKNVDNTLERLNKNKEDLHSFYYDWEKGDRADWVEEKEFDEWMKVYMPDDDDDDDDDDEVPQAPERDDMPAKDDKDDDDEDPAAKFERVMAEILAASIWVFIRVCK
jgi:hypothetical protein